MALVTSGTISIGGTTAGRSINLELGRSATATSSLGESALRNLANDTSGAISMSAFYGKSSAETQTVTVGTFYDGTAYIPTTSWGYGQSQGYGSISDGTLGVVGNANILVLSYNSLEPSVGVSVSGTVANSGFTTMTVAGTAYSRSAASFYQNTVAGTPLTTSWRWATTTNPFGTTVGATKAVVFT